MKYRIIPAACLLTFFANLNAQVGAGKVSYRRILNVDATSHKIDSIGTRAILFFRPAQSLFIYNSEYTKRNDPAIKVTNEADTYSFETIDKDGESIFTDYARNEITIREFVWKKPYISGEPIPSITWTVEKDVRFFGKIICHKATTSFRGRSYNAWFTYDIPFKLGPWKLQGLPGLILEASDSENEVQFKFESIEIPSKEVISFQPPTQGKRVNFSEFKELWISETEKLYKFIQSTAEKGAAVDLKLNYYPIEKSY
ncbi:MAG: GLPGLI family protein [Ferruginibacter sp.]